MLKGAYEAEKSEKGEKEGGGADNLNFIFHCRFEKEG